VPRVFVELLGPMCKPGGESRLELDLPPGSRITDLLTALEYPEQQHRFLVVIRNRNRSTLSTPLEDGDELQLLLPIGGG